MKHYSLQKLGIRRLCGILLFAGGFSISVESTASMCSAAEMVGIVAQCERGPIVYGGGPTITYTYERYDATQVTVFCSFIDAGGQYRYGQLGCTNACPAGSASNFGTGNCVPPPFEGAATTAPKPNKEPNNCTANPTSGNPVSFDRGEKKYHFVDFQESSAFPLKMEQYYNSWVNIETHSTLAQWNFSYTQYVWLDDTTTPTKAILFRANGSFQNFIKTGGVWVSASGNPANALVQDTGISKWRYVLADGSEEKFDLNNGKLLSIKNPQGLQQTLAYTASGFTVTQQSTGEYITVSFDAVSGNIKSFTDTTGVNTWNYGWSTDGSQLLTVTTPDNFIRRFEYDTTKNKNNTSLVTGIFETQDSVETRYSNVEYDYLGRVAISELFNGTTGTESLTFSYNWCADGLAWCTPTTTMTPVTTVTSQDGASNALSTTYAFDTHDDMADQNWYVSAVNGNGNVSTSCDATATAKTWLAQPSGTTNYKIDAKIDANGNVTSFTYDSRNRTTAMITGQSGTVSSYSPTNASQKITTTGFVGDTTLPTGKTYYGHSGGSWSAYRSEAFAYDGNNRLASRVVTDLLYGGTRSWSYSNTYSGSVLQQTTVTDSGGHNAVYGYTSGRLTGIANAAGHSTTYANYNSMGLPRAMTVNGVATILSYDVHGRLTGSSTAGAATVITYWPNGLTKRITSPDGSYLQYTYNSAHQLTGVVNQFGESITLTPSLLNGQWTSAVVKNSSSAVVTQQARVQDALGRVWKQLDAGSNPKTVFNYDANDNLRAVIELGNAVNLPTHDDASRATTRSFDGQNRVTGESRCTDSGTPTFPYSCASALATTTYTYDDQGNVHTVTDANTHVTTYTYNGFGELETQESPDTGVTTYAYDAVGNLASKTKGYGSDDEQVIVYTWDALNRLATINYPGTDRDVAYTYDEGTYGAGHLTHVIDASGRTDYAYNALGKVITKTETLPGSIVQVTDYVYSTAGVLEKTVYPSGLEITAASSAGKATGLSDTTDTAATLLSAIAHQPFGGIQGWQTATAPEAINRYFRTFDANGRMAGWGIGSSSEQAETTLGYDAYGNISAVNSYDSGKSELYAYDGLSRLSQVTANYGRIGYSYDAVGNRTQTVYEKQDPATLAWQEFYTEAYDIATGSNRLEGIARSKGTTALRTRAFGYDARGNIKTDTRQKTGATATVHSLNYGNSDRLDTLSAP